MSARKRDRSFSLTRYDVGVVFTSASHLCILFVQRAGSAHSWCERVLQRAYEDV